MTFFGMYPNNYIGASSMYGENFAAGAAKINYFASGKLDGQAEANSSRNLDADTFVKSDDKAQKETNKTELKEDVQIEAKPETVEVKTRQAEPPSETNAAAEAESPAAPSYRPASSGVLAAVSLSGMRKNVSF